MTKKIEPVVPIRMQLELSKGDWYELGRLLDIASNINAGKKKFVSTEAEQLSLNLGRQIWQSLTIEDYKLPSMPLLRNIP